MRNERIRLMIRVFAIAAVLILSAMLRGPWRSEDSVVFSFQNWFVVVSYAVMVILWGDSVRLRVIHRKIRARVFGTCFSLLLLIFLRELRFRAWHNILPAERWLWYAYYIPMLLIPLFSYHAVLYIGRPEDWRLPLRAYVVTGMTFCFVLGILTNDWHHLAFRFPADAGVDWSGSYTHGPLYAAATGWSFLLLVGTLVHLWHRCRLEHRLVRMLPTVGFLLLGAGYTAGYIWGSAGKLMELTAMFCAATIGFWECCLQTDLIPGNEQYRELFSASTISAAIVDEDYHIRYRSENAGSFPLSVMIHAENGPILLDDGLRLRSAPVGGGHVLWMEDISDVNRMLSNLKETGERLAGNNELLGAELDLKRRLAATAAKNRIYDRMSREMREPLERMDRLLSEEKDAGGAIAREDIRRRLAAVCVIGAYVKRRSNLILIGENADTVPAEEAALCLRESADALNASGIPATLDRRCEGPMSREAAWLLYDIFEEMTERALPALSGLSLRLTADEGWALLRCEARTPSAFLPADWKKEALEPLGGRLTVKEEEGKASLALSFSPVSTHNGTEGGERA